MWQIPGLRTQEIAHRRHQINIPAENPAELLSAGEDLPPVVFGGVAGEVDAGQGLEDGPADHWPVLVLELSQSLDKLIVVGGGVSVVDDGGPQAVHTPL
jgi:hypothetical protein